MATRPSRKIEGNLDALMPQTATDPIHMFHKSFLHHAFLYVDLREAIRWEDTLEMVDSTLHWHRKKELCS